MLLANRLAAITFAIVSMPAALLALTTTEALAAGDAAAGEKKAAMCKTCHGANGIATLPEAPNLAGQNPIYFVKALTEYKTGARKNAQMGVVAPTLTDTDIADLAAYYGSMKVEVKPRP